MRRLSSTFFCAALLLCTPSTVLPQVMFQHQITGTGTQYNWIPSVTVAPTGDILLSTISVQFGSGWPTPVLTKVDTAGNVRWMRYDSAGVCVQVNKVVRATPSHYQVATDRASLLSDGGYALRELDTAGTELWRRLYQREFLIVADACAAADSGVYFCATWSNATHVVKLDSAGALLWSRLYFSSGDLIRPYCITGTPDGGAIVGGQFAAGGFQQDLALMRLDDTGNVVWARTYPHTSTLQADRVNSVRPTADGGYIAALQAPVNNNGYMKGELMKVFADGSIAWQTAYAGATDNTVFYDVREMDDGGFAVTGLITDIDHYQDACLARMDASGALKWARGIGLGRDETAQSLAVMPDGGYAIGATTWTSDLLNNAAYLIRTDTAGDAGCLDTLALTTDVPFDLTSMLLTISDSTFHLMADASAAQTWLSLAPVVEEPCAAAMNVSDALAIDELNVWPNPAESRIYIHAPSPVERVELWQLDGRLLRSAGPVQALSLEGLAHGTYVLRVFSRGRCWTGMVGKE